MLYCDFKHVRDEPDGGIYACRRKGCDKPHGPTKARRIVRVCCSPDALEEEYQITRILGKGWRFTKAVRKWVMSGCLVRKEHEVAEIYNKYCLPCEFITTNKSSCGHPDCGCRVGKRLSPLSNKLVMATENCPDGRW